LELGLLRLKWELVFVKQSNVTGFATSKFNGHHYVRNKNCVFKEHPANSVIMFASRNGDAKLSLQKSPAFVA
jgi:hypothetical protein